MSGKLTNDTLFAKELLEMTKFFVVAMAYRISVAKYSSLRNERLTMPKANAPLKTLSSTTPPVEVLLPYCLRILARVRTRIRNRKEVR